MNILLSAIFPFASSFIATYFLVPLFSRIAVRFGILDIPDGVIKKHDQATPYLGGLAVYGGFIIGIACSMPDPSHILFLIGVSLALAVGLIDDVRPLTPAQKFLGQIVAVLPFLKAGFYLKEQFFYGAWFFAIPLSLVWMLTIMNAFNLVDIMDGLATTIALVATFWFLVLAIMIDNQPLSTLLVCLLGALCAFLIYNRPKASIYLGDTGSLFLGAFLGAVPFFIPSWTVYNQYGYLAPALIVGIALGEVGSLILLRTYKSIPFYKASRDHFAHYLQKWGLKTGYILVVVFISAMIFGFIGTLFFLSVLNLYHLAAFMALIISLWLILVSF